jgi:hypothetical protein
MQKMDKKSKENLSKEMKIKILFNKIRQQIALL